MKNAILIIISIWIGSWGISNVVNVYFNNVRQQMRIGGVGHTINIVGSIPAGDLSHAKIPLEKEEDGKKEVVKKEEKAKDGQSTIKREEIVAKIPNLYISQEYPCSQKRTYRESINLSNGDHAVMTWKDKDQAMWFGIRNIDLFNVSNPTLFLSFNGDYNVSIRDDEAPGWLMMDPNRDFSMKIRGEVQPGSGLRLNPLFVKFPKPGIYHARYSIATDNNLPKSGTFTIKVVE